MLKNRIIACMMMLFTVSFSAQWLTPIEIEYPGNDPSFSSDNLRMYITLVNGDPASKNIAYNNWDGNGWVWGGDVTGDIRTNDNEFEEFITADSQWMYFVRLDSLGQTRIFRAHNNGSGVQFNGSVPLGPQVNGLSDSGVQYANYPSITADGQKLYFTAMIGGKYRIFESTWLGNNWGMGTMLPPTVNGPQNWSRTDVCITPDGTELYFTVITDDPTRAYLAFSRKINGSWQPWEYCGHNINPPGTESTSHPAFTYGDYANQELYFDRTFEGVVTDYRVQRTPTGIQTGSLGSIKVQYYR